MEEIKETTEEQEPEKPIDEQQAAFQEWRQILAMVVDKGEAFFSEDGQFNMEFATDTEIININLKRSPNAGL